MPCSHALVAVLVAVSALACAPHTEAGDPAVHLAPAWAEVTPVRDDGQRPALARHAFAGALELPDSEAGESLDFYTGVALAPAGLYLRGKEFMRFDDGRLPADAEIVDGHLVDLLRRLELEFAADGWKLRRVGLFADRRVRFATFWPVYRTLEHALQVMAVKIAVHRLDDPQGTTRAGLHLSDAHDWDGSMRLAGNGAAIPDDPLSALQLAVVIGPEQIEVGRIHPTGVVQPLELIPNADGLAPLARLAERLYTTRDPNAYGKVGALLYAHDEAPVERVVAVASSLMGPTCGPAEHAAETSPACWFTVRLEGRRASLDRMKLDRW